jgi:CheY-like chemotaxis protein/anti-sigma regulatory factor (Ser/Thr protein kinase)
MTTVLVADHDSDYRLLVRLALDGTVGFAPVLAAADMAETMSVAEAARPDVILLEVSLPGAFEIASWLVGQDEPPKLVLVSSRPPDELAAVAAATGAVGYLGKDLAPSGLPSAIGEIVRLVDRLESLLAKTFKRLPPDGRSAGEARRLIRRTLEGWCADDQLDDIALCVSELVTNAVVHAGSGPRVLVHVRPGAIHVEISDDSEVLPTVRAAGPDDTSGRGVSILGALSDQWGSRRRSGGGKTVWFDIGRATNRRGGSDQVEALR